jgi:hypothetical protein
VTSRPAALAVTAIAVALSMAGCRDRGAAPVSHLPTVAPVATIEVVANVTDCVT